MNEQIALNVIANLDKFGAILHKTRTERGLSMYTLAKRAGISQHVITLIETGKGCNIFTAQKLVRALFEEKNEKK